MGGQVAANGDEHALGRGRPRRVQLLVEGEAGLEALVAVELAILAQQDVAKRAEQPGRRMAALQVAPDQASGGVDLLLDVKQIAQLGYYPRLVGPALCRVALVGQARRRHVQEAVE